MITLQSVSLPTSGTALAVQTLPLGTHSHIRDKSEISLAIACPMANEGSDASRFVEELLQYCDGFRTVRFLAVLDQVSTDNTRAVLESLAARDSRVKVIWAPECQCIVDVYKRGYREALATGADWILEIDAGFSHLPEDAPLLFDEMLKGRDCVFGSRFMPGGSMKHCPVWRRFVSSGGTLLTNLMVGTELHDMTSGFELFSRDALQMVLEKGIDSRGHFFQTEIKTFCRKLRICEVPIRYENASPRLKATAITESFRQLWRLRAKVKAGLI